LFYDVLYRAPLGAIIRKGGLGLPIIFAVLIFISFTSSTLSEENSTGKWNVSFYGAWMIYPVTTSYIVNLSRNK
jgi:lipopolysaccharide export system permease protein